MLKLRMAMLAAVVLVGAEGTARAEAPQRAALPPIEHAEATLALVRADGRMLELTPATLEQLTTYRMVTTTPWRPAPAVFEGVLLSDVLEIAGLGTADSIVITAENDFQVEMPRAVWATYPILLATRVNGQPHTRRDRGPIQFVMNDEDYSRLGKAYEKYLVWMAARIEPN